MYNRRDSENLLTPSYSCRICVLLGARVLRRLDPGKDNPQKWALARDATLMARALKYDTADTVTGTYIYISTATGRVSHGTRLTCVPVTKTIIAHKSTPGRRLNVFRAHLRLGSVFGGGRSGFHRHRRK